MLSRYFKYYNYLKYLLHIALYECGGGNDLVAWQGFLCFIEEVIFELEFEDHHLRGVREG